LGFEQTAIDLGTITISTFALLIVLALGVGGGITLWRARHEEVAVDTILQMAIWAIVLGVIFGRLFYVLNPPPSVAAYYDRVWYGQHLLDLQVGPLAFWSGGLDNGGIAVGGLLALGWIMWRRKLDIDRWAKWLIVGLLSGLAISPLGNFLSGRMFGPPTSLPWGVAIAERTAPYNDVTQYPASTRFQPTPIYFVLLALLTLAIVLLVERRQPEMSGGIDLFVLGWGLYGAGAVLLGFWQVDVSRGLLHLSGLQGVMLVTVILLAGVKGWLWKRNSRS